MSFRRVQRNHVLFHKWREPLVAPLFVVSGKPLTHLKPISSEKILITISNKQNHATSDHKLEPLPGSCKKSPIPTSTFKNKDVSSVKLPEITKNNDDGTKMRPNSKDRTSSINGTYKIHKKRRPPSVIGTKNGKKVSFAKTNDISSTLTSTIGGGIEQTRIIPRSILRTTHSGTNSQEHPKVPIRRYVRVVCLFPNTNKPLRFNDYVRLLELNIDPTDKFTDPKKFIHFLKEKTNEALFLIIPNDIAQSIIHNIHHLYQVNTIYILGETKRKNKQWIKNWVKIKNIYPTIQSICEILKYDTRQYRRDSMAISMSSLDLEHLDASFMYTRLLTEILLEMGYDDRAKQAFAQFCRRYLDTKNSHNFPVIDKFEKEYEPHESISWYTRGCFLYGMINEALRKQDIDIIIKAGFFIRDLQKQIETQYKPPTEKIIVYRGQRLSDTDFEQLCLRKGGLYSFNTFLSTSKDRCVAYAFAESNRGHEQIGIIFHIEIDSNIFTPTQWALISTESKYSEEEEILFAMHSVFRIGEIKRIESRFWQVQLSLTSDDDSELKQITEFIREATQGSSGWDRLGKLLLKIGKFSHAEEIFQMLIENTAEDDAHSLGHRYHMLGLIYEQGKCDYKNALIFYDKALNIYLQYSDSNYLDLITIYNNIGGIYRHTENYSKALETFQMALDNQKNKCRTYNVVLAETYNNIAETYKCLKQYSEALQFYRRALSIQKKAVPLNMTDLGETYSNIAKIYYITEEYSRALVLFRKVSRIQQYNHSSNNINTAINDTNIGEVHEKLKEFPIALAYYSKALGVLSQCNSSNIAELTNTYDNIARVYKNMNDNTKALQFYKKVLYNLRKHPRLKQPNLGTTYYSMGQIYKNIRKIDKATVSYRQAILFEESIIFPDNFKLQLYLKHLAEARIK
ncbi:unnamed protein product [Adineta steineri]|uniref:NAD(P)(+)--arginine ADP-ribosyltransferase n=2 Tax=Adineta steineri TaxID=433720 RepID=A0A813QZ52_9BILA|nr:unnamed protein product [Adineta steineri]